MSDDEKTVDVPTDGFWSSGKPVRYPVEVEPDSSRFDASPVGSFERNEVIAFEVPDTLPKARSAFCHDPAFHDAIQVFADEKMMNPERALRENTGMLLWVEVDKLERVEETEETVTIPQLKQAYVDGRIDEAELEDRLDELVGL